MRPALHIEPYSSVEAKKMHRNNFGDIMAVIVITAPLFWLHILKFYYSVWLRVIRRSCWCRGPLVTSANYKRSILHWVWNY